MHGQRRLIGHDLRCSHLLVGRGDDRSPTVAATGTTFVFHTSTFLARKNTCKSSPKHELNRSFRRLKNLTTPCPRN